MEWDAYGNYGAHNHAWNRYLGSPQYIDDALIPYKYSFACENSFINEKLSGLYHGRNAVFLLRRPQRHHDHFNYNNLEWHINKTKDELLDSDYADMKIKGDVVSSVISGKAFTEGHKLRTAFALHAQNFMEWDAYGNYGAHNHAWNRYLGSPQYKDDALIPYKYSFACENSFINEKLVDCIMAETLCFYCGAPNVSRFIDPEAYIQLDLRNGLDAAVATMKNAIANGAWEKRLPAIKRAKHKILTETSMLWDVIYADKAGRTT